MEETQVEGDKAEGVEQTQPESQASSSLDTKLDFAHSEMMKKMRKMIETDRNELTQQMEVQRKQIEILQANQKQMKQLMEDQQNRMIQFIEAMHPSMKSCMMDIVDDAVEQEVAGAMASVISVNNDNKDDKEHQVEALYNKNDKVHIDVSEILSNYNKNDKEHVDEPEIFSETLSVTTLCLPLTEFLCNRMVKPHIACIIEMVEIERNVVPAGLPRSGIG